MGTVAGISGVENPMLPCLDHKPTPQGTVAVERAAGREVLRGRQRDRERSSARGPPPVELFDLAEARRPEEGCVAEGRHRRRMKPAFDQLQGPGIAVVVVIV